MGELSSFRIRAVLTAVCLSVGLAFPVGLQGQPTNLVLNGSFEERVGCPQFYYQFNTCAGWTWHHGSPDYYHRCSGGSGGVPLNAFGFQDIEDSDSAYAGLMSYYPDFEGGQEIMKGVLTTTLVAGTKYRVRFQVSMADSSNYLNCCIGVILSSVPPPLPPYSVNLSDVELVLSPEQYNTDDWFQLDATYTAVGGEDKIYIGSFRSEAEAAIVPNPYGTVNHAYFYINNVEVYEDDTVTGAEEVGAVRIRAWHHDGQIMLRGMPTGAVAVLYDIAGRAVASDQGDVPAHGLSGLYVLRVSDVQGNALHVQKIVVGL